MLGGSPAVPKVLDDKVWRVPVPVARYQEPFEPFVYSFATRRPICLFPALEKAASNANQFRMAQKALHLVFVCVRQFLFPTKSTTLRHVSKFNSEFFLSLYAFILGRAWRLNKWLLPRV